MKKEGYSRPGLFGTMNHYDNRGHKVGHSRTDNNGHKTSHSDRGLFGGFNHYDN